MSSLPASDPFPSTAPPTPHPAETAAALQQEGIDRARAAATARPPTPLASSTPGEWSHDDLPMMEAPSRGMTGEAAARKVVIDAAREALVLLVSDLDGDGAARALLQIERVSKCFRAATAHLGQPVYPEELGKMRRHGYGQIGLMGGGPFGGDRETMGVQAFQSMLSTLNQQAVSQVPKSIDAYLSAAETARRLGKTALAEQLEAKAESLTANLDKDAQRRVDDVAAATASVARMADAAEGFTGPDAIGFGGDGTGGVDNLDLELGGLGGGTGIGAAGFGSGFVLPPAYNTSGGDPDADLFQDEDVGGAQ